MSFNPGARARSQFHSHSLGRNLCIWATWCPQTAWKLTLLQQLLKGSGVRYSAVETRGMKCNYTAHNETNNFDILTATKDHISATHLGIIIKERFSYTHVHSPTEKQKLPSKELGHYIPSAPPHLSLNRKTMDFFLFLKKIVERKQLYTLSKEN